MAEREKVMGVDLTGYRLSDESLKRILEDIIKDIWLRRMHGIYDMPIVNCINPRDRPPQPAKISM